MTDKEANASAHSVPPKFRGVWAPAVGDPSQSAVLKEKEILLQEREAFRKQKEFKEKTEKEEFKDEQKRLAEERALKLKVEEDTRKVEERKRVEQQLLEQECALRLQAEERARMEQQQVQVALIAMPASSSSLWKPASLPITVGIVYKISGNDWCPSTDRRWDAKEVAWKTEAGNTMRGSTHYFCTENNPVYGTWTPEGEFNWEMLYRFDQRWYNYYGTYQNGSIAGYWWLKGTSYALCASGFKGEFLYKIHECGANVNIQLPAPKQKNKNQENCSIQ